MKVQSEKIKSGVLTKLKLKIGEHQIQEGVTHDTRSMKFLFWQCLSTSRWKVSEGDFRTKLMCGFVLRTVDNCWHSGRN